MKYKFLNKKRIFKITPLMEKWQKGYVYANEEDNPANQFKELVVEEKPTYDKETQELYSWFENGEVITQKFKVIDKDVI